MKLMKLMIFAMFALSVVACNRDNDDSDTGGDAVGVWKLTKFESTGSQKVSTAGISSTVYTTTGTGANYDVTFTITAPNTYVTSGTFDLTEVTNYTAGIPAQTLTFEADLAEEGTWVKSGNTLTTTSGISNTVHKILTLNDTTLKVEIVDEETVDLGTGSTTDKTTATLTFTRQ